jgi:hypothetical protein
VPAIRDAALLYAHLGLSVIPLRGKAPWFDDWPNRATDDPDVIAGWWEHWPTVNVGIATGVKSNVFVVDIDPEKGGRDSWDDLRTSGIPDTWQAITGRGGTHYYFRYPKFRVKTCAGILPGIDIRGEGGQAVAPPSVHPDTHRRYEWDGSKPIDQQPIAEPPGWMLDLLRPKEVQREHVFVPERIPKGVQHTTLVSMAGQLRRMGLTPPEIFPSLMAVNQNRCEEPGPEPNIRKIADSMAKYEPSSRSLYAEANKLWSLTRYYEEQKTQQVKVSGLKSAYDLLKNPPPAQTEIIEGILHNGSTICAGRPKVGKSWLALQMAISVAVGAPFMGWCRVKKPGGVLYGALEESDSLTSNRLKLLLQEGSIQLQNLQFFYSIPGGTLESLAKMITEANPTLVIIDTYLALFKQTHPQSGRGNLLAEDYAKTDWATQLANKIGCAIVLIHHTRKDSTGQKLDAVIGTSGTTANAECIWTLDRRPEHKAELSIVSRHAAETEFILSLDIKNGIGWSVEEAGEDVHHSDVDMEIVAVLKELGSATAKQLSVELRKSPAASRMALLRLHKKGKITKTNDSYSLVEGRPNVLPIRI